MYNSLGKAALTLGSMNCIISTSRRGIASLVSGHAPNSKEGMGWLF
jgi:hypothetical protein